MPQAEQPQSTSLWAEAFEGYEARNHRDAAERMRVAWVSARQVAEDLSGEIARDLPSFTQHNLSHIDALWRTASVIAGNGYGINPAEGFVLGLAFITHDIAMSKASYQLAGTDVRSDASWPDALGIEFRRHYGRPPTAAELGDPPADIAAEVEIKLLRELHARQAATIASVGWTVEGETYHLISDDELRATYGRVIGIIAASHHLESSRMASELGARVGAPVFLPSNWTIDPVELACLLRTADAAHLDAGRAPSVLRATRPLDDTAQLHWGFQAKLHQPFPQDDRLVYTAATAFSQDDADQWWLAYDTLRMVDEELRACDAILESRGSVRFAMRGVSRIELATQLQSLIPCDGWEPVHAGVHVSEVAELVQKLGGRQLYGNAPEVALRELVANATDAVRALSALNGRRGAKVPPGRVDLVLEVADDARHWLQISDTGIGMSKEVLTGALLDFGRSSWLSESVLRDNPGLAASPFEPTGRFGIGFFAAFMIADAVSVTSRGRTAAEVDTWVLEFASGLGGRANLRRAKDDERLPTPGTTVRLALQPRYASDGYIKMPVEVNQSWYASTVADSVWALIRYLFPVSDVDIWTAEDGDCRLAVGADDWVDCEGEELLKRLAGFDLLEDEDERDLISRGSQRYGQHLTVIRDETGRPVARVAFGGGEVDGLFNEDLRTPSCVVTAGISSSTAAIRWLVGVALGRPDTAARTSATPIFFPDLLRPWAEDQFETLESESRSSGNKVSTYWMEFAAELGLPRWNMRGWRLGQRWFTVDELVDALSELSVVNIADPGDLEIFVGNEEHQIDVSEDVVAFDVVRSGLVPGRSDGDGDPWHVGPPGSFDSLVFKEFTSVLQRSWKLQDPPSTGGARELVQIGTFRGAPVREWCNVVRRQPTEDVIDER